jgi:hypothetical protein
MKITKDVLKQLIKEELGGMAGRLARGAIANEEPDPDPGLDRNASMASQIDMLEFKLKLLEETQSNILEWITKVNRQLGER